MIRVLLMRKPDAASATFSGVHKYFYELVRSMPEDVEYRFVYPGEPAQNACAYDPPAQHADVAKKQVAGFGQFLPLSARLVLGYGKDIVRLARTLRPFRNEVDVLHVVAGGCEISPIAAKLAGFKYVVDTVQAMHGEEQGADNWVRRLVERLCFRCSDYHIFVSDATRESWEQRLGRRFPYNCTIYNGMRPADLSGFDRTKYRAQFVDDSDDAFFIGICARLHHMKGHRVLIEAFAALCTEKIADCRLQTADPAPLHPCSLATNLYLLIAGDGPERENIEKQISALPKSVRERIVLVGHRDDPCRFVACLDLHVMASTSIETIGYANIEAMFAGIPCVVSDVGGAKEIVRASGGGIVVRAGDVANLSDAMLLYIRDSERCTYDGQHGKKYADQHLSAQVMVEKTLGVYRQVLR